MSKKLTQKEAVAACKQTHGNKYVYTNSIYTSRHEPMSVTCKTHGCFTMSYGSHVSGQGCPKCAGRGWSLKDFVTESKLVHKNRFDYSKVKWVGKSAKVELVCNSCSPKHTLWQKASKHISGQGCPVCARKCLASDYAHVVKKSKEVHGDTYTIPKQEVINKNDSIDIECKIHGVFKQTIANHIYQHAGCPSCARERERPYSKRSKIEKKVSKYVKTLTDELGVSLVLGDRKVLKGYELDIWCPEHKLAIEVNGLYWHSEKHKTPEYHYTKALEVKKAKAQLIQFWEHELNEKSDICKSIIKSHLGLSDRWYARQLTIERLTPAAARKFFDRNHLQGYAQASVTYGLFNRTECLAAMSFGRPRFNKNYEWEIVRFANSLNTTVVGGASRLFTHFKRTNKPKSVISYADLRISQGQVYKTLGFDFSHVSKPNWMLHNGNKIVTRYQTQKHKLQTFLKDRYKPKLTARANLAAAGWCRVYDAGNLVFTMTCVKQ